MERQIKVRRSPFLPQRMRARSRLRGWCPEALKVAVRKVASAIPTFTTKWLEGQTHNLGAVPAAAMMKELFRLICRFSPTPFDR